MSADVDVSDPSASVVTAAGGVTSGAAAVEAEITLLIDDQFGTSSAVRMAA